MRWRQGVPGFNSCHDTRQSTGSSTGSSRGNGEAWGGAVQAPTRGFASWWRCWSQEEACGQHGAGWQPTATAAKPGRRRHVPVEGDTSGGKHPWVWKRQFCCSGWLLPTQSIPPGMASLPVCREGHGVTKCHTCSPTGMLTLKCRTLWEVALAQHPKESAATGTLPSPENQNRAMHQSPPAAACARHGGEG